MLQGSAKRLHRCRRCGKVYPNLGRLMHHVEAEHAIRNIDDIRTHEDAPSLRDIRTNRDIRHRPPSNL